MRLITSPFEELYNSKNKKILLGNWSCLHDDKEKHEIIEYHWFNRKKFKKDFDYLNKIILKLNEDLAVSLNHLHNVNFSKKFWFLIINPWLSMFVSAMFDRWESINKALKINKISEIAFLDIKKNLAPDSFNHYLKFYNSHNWNHNVFKDIIKYLKIKHPNIVLVENKKNYKDYKHQISKKNIFKIIIDKLFSKIDNNSVVLIDHYFNFIDLLQLSLNLGQPPRMYHEFYQRIIIPQTNQNLRNKIKINLDDNKFEEFLSNYIIQNIPTSYVEGFNKILEATKKISIKTDLIITGNSNFPTEVCKFWCALQSEKKIKIILTEHGGSIPTKYRYYDIHNKIFEKQISWSKPTSEIETRLSPSKLIRFKNLKTSKKKISIVTLETSQYAYYCQNLQSSLIVKDYEQKVKMMEDLKKKNIEFSIKTYQNKGWNLEKKYKDKFGDKIICHKDMKSVLNESKLIICTYPETTFIESMISNVPTILVFLNDVWTFNEKFDDLVRNLKENNIIFSNVKDASNHVEEINKDPYKWWNSEVIKNSRNYFLKECGDVSQNWLNEWKQFILENKRTK